MSMTGLMYKLIYDREFDDDYMIIETLTNVVCMMNCRTNYISWIAKHQINAEFKLKQKTE